MLVNLAEKFFELFHTIALVSRPKSEPLTSYFKMVGPFFKKFLGLNLYYWLVL